MTHFLRYQFPAIFWAIVIFILSSIPASKLPSFSTLINDKLIHSIIFFVFGLLVYRAFEPRMKPNTFNWGRLLIAVFIVVMYGVVDEFHQGFVPGRTVDVLDASADAFGGILSAFFIYLNYKHKNSQNTGHCDVS